MCNSDDDLPISNYLKNNNFTITIQPRQNFHCRYVTELKNSHGYLMGQQPFSKRCNEVYPSVQLLLPQDGHLDEFENARDFYILCTLHNFDEKCLSPHLLLAKGVTAVNYKFIFEKMEQNAHNPLERYWKLQEYVIVRLKLEEFKKSLQFKSREYKNLQLPIDFSAIQGQLDLNNDKSVKNSGNLNLCLGFTIYEKDFYNNTYRLYKETIYSNNIYHGDDIKIHHLCNTKGSIHGGTTITILIKLNSNFPLNIRITRINEQTNQTEWKKEVPVKNEDIFGKHAIIFTLPAYEGPSCSDDEIEVNIEVVVTGTTYKSQNVKFYYLNTAHDSRQRKRARNAWSEVKNEDEEEEAVVSSSNNDTDTQLTAMDPIELHYQPIPSANDMDIVNQSNAVTELPSITSFEPHTDFDVASILNALCENDFGNDPSEDIFIDQSEFLLGVPCMGVDVPSTSDFEYVSRDKGLPLFKEEIDTTEKMDMLKAALPVDPIYEIKNKIDKILEMSKNGNNIDITGLQKTDGNTIFHEALDATESFIYLYKMSKRSQCTNLVLKARNKNRENLLHFACKHNKSMCIRPLIGMGCRLNEQDNSGRTPLHIAMEHNYNDCIEIIQQLLNDHSKYPKEVEESLIKMFKTYNHNGYTVLHAAVIDNRLELVKIMLDFCRKYHVNIIDYEVLGNGDSVVHLVVKHNLIDMMKLVRQYVPYYMTIENYPGTTILDLPDTAVEMLQALRDK